MTCRALFAGAAKTGPAPAGPRAFARLLMMQSNAIRTCTALGIRRCGDLIFPQYASFGNCAVQLQHGNYE
ncbi:hypothetical protein A9D14_00110 [Croceicoccus marinus]|uniref:Uncharacterized protein n=1 Tax=Croceicoccus marinus TaxID=450378 RepID=A0A1Z1F7S6_9SPHN|nr:hypothetical protein A9D14_00110 [Croceicoccus marinus]